MNTLKLKMDIQKVIDACNDEVDHFLAIHKAVNEDEREILELAYRQKRKKLNKICEEIIAQYDRQD